METKMYVIAHNKAAIPRLPHSYVSMLVGAALHKVDGGFDERDDSGENISEKNPNYCELTGLYWVWKNSKADIVGISHYRRFLSKNAIFGSSRHFVTKEEMERLMERKRVVLPKPKRTSKTMLQASKYAPNKADLKEMFEATAACAPEYLEDFKWYFRQNKSYMFNMCIMKKADFDAYCAWLFPILSHVEKIHDMDAETDPYRRRLYGFLSERLFPVWVHHNVAPSDIAEFHVVNTSESDLTRIRRWCGNVCRNALYRLTRNGEKQKRAHAGLEQEVFGVRRADERP